jgi:translation initiation factor RLI1
MPKRRAVIDYDKCLPDKCAPNDGICLAARACTHHIMEQEEPYESPMIMHADMCQGCSDCSDACPLDAIRLAYF